MNKNKPPEHPNFRCLYPPFNLIEKEDAAKAIVKAALIKLGILGNENND